MPIIKQFISKYKMALAIYIAWFFINIALLLMASPYYDPKDCFIPFQARYESEISWRDYDISEFFVYTVTPLAVFIIYYLFRTDTKSKKQMEWEDYQKIRDIIAEKAKALMRHEGKSFARIGHDMSNYVERTIDNRHFWIITTNTFREIINNVLSEACEKYPELFGQKDAWKVLQALFNIEPPALVRNLKEFEEFLRNEHCAYVMEVNNDKVIGDILRVDLFRKIDSSTEGYDFTGGAFHALKHFTYKEVPLSTHSENAPLSHPSEIYDILITGFFISTDKVIETKNGKDKIVSLITYKGKEYKLAFYHEINTDVFFLATFLRQ